VVSVCPPQESKLVGATPLSPNYPYIGIPSAIIAIKGE